MKNKKIMMTEARFNAIKTLIEGDIRFVKIAGIMDCHTSTIGRVKQCRDWNSYLIWKEDLRLHNLAHYGKQKPTKPAQLPLIEPGKTNMLSLHKDLREIINLLNVMIKEWEPIKKENTGTNVMIDEGHE